VNNTNIVGGGNAFSLRRTQLEARDVTVFVMFIITSLIQGTSFNFVVAQLVRKFPER
jgi:hypothetical protein